MTRDVVLWARNLTLSYGKRPVLHGVSLELRRGSTLGVVGRSGSGKTALARLLAALPPEGATAHGTLAWPGKEVDLSAWSSARRRRDVAGHLAWLPQEAQGALHAQLRLGSQLAETTRAAGSPADAGALRAWFTTVGLDHALLDRFPHEVSGGQAQRAVLACVLAQSPAVLVADEPTSALDAGTGSAILDVLHGGARDGLFALVLVTHDLVAASRCDRLVVLDGGRVAEAGSAAAVLSQPASEAARRLVAATDRLRSAC